MACLVSLLVAAIFFPYMILMGVLFAYIICTGRPPDSDGDDEPEPALG